MKMINYLSSLLPSFGKDRVTDDCRLTRTEIKEFTLPAYDSALTVMSTWDFKSTALTGQLDQFKRMVKGGNNPIVTIHKAFTPILENLDEIEALVTKTYSEDVAGLGMTYLKGNLLQLVETIAFVSKFARKFLVYVYVCETSEFENGGTVIADSLAPAEIEWINANFVSFCIALNIASGSPQQMKKQIADIPDIVITSENAVTLSATIGDKKIDPFQMGLIPIWLNPIYHVGMFIAEWQADRYKAAKEEHRLLSLRLLNLEKMKADKTKPDAGLQKEISHLESRVQDINFRLVKMERHHA